jgi:PhnB protein
MAFKVEPYLFFDGNCDEAIETYRRILGAEVTMLMRYKESPDPLPPGAVPPGWDNKVMHANLRIGDSFLMLSDGKSQKQTFGGFALSLTVPDEAAGRKTFGALADGGQVVMPLGKPFFAKLFGMVTDRFGVMWMVILPA